MIEMHTCPTCGFEWAHGQNGSHSCVDGLRAEIARLRGEKARAVKLAFRYGGIDGEHHKTWVIDQMVRALLGDGYEAAVIEACDGENGPDTYEWDEGIAP